MVFHNSIEFGRAEKLSIRVKAIKSADNNYFAAVSCKQQIELQATTFVKLFQSACRTEGKEIQSGYGF